MHVYTDGSKKDENGTNKKVYSETFCSNNQPEELAITRSLCWTNTVQIDGTQKEVLFIGIEW